MFLNQKNFKKFSKIQKHHGLQKHTGIWVVADFQKKSIINMFHASDEKKWWFWTLFRGETGTFPPADRTMSPRVKGCRRFLGIWGFDIPCGTNTK